MDFYYDGSNYFNGTIGPNIPRCENLGLSCSELYTMENLTMYISTIGNFVLNPFLSFLIFAKMNDGFLKYFTLNVMFMCITSSVAVFVSDLIYFASLFYRLEGIEVYLAWIETGAVLFSHLGFMWYHALMLYAAIVSYLPYVNPILYTSKFVNKSQIPYYVVLHISVFLWGGSTVGILYRTGIFIPYCLTHIVLFIALFIVALMGTIKIIKYKPLGVDAIQVSKIQQKRLYTFIMYTYSIEVITLPMFVHTCARIICVFAGCEYSTDENSFIFVLHIAIFFCRRMRVIFVVLITILAYEPFRSATFSLFTGKKWTSEVKSVQTLETK